MDVDSVNYGHVISPLLARHSLARRGKVSGSFTYTNAFFDDSKDLQEFSVFVTFIYQNNGTPVIMVKTPPDLKKYDMSKWVSVSEHDFSLRKGEQKEIYYTINVPSTPAPGGKYAAIIVAKTSILEKALNTGAELKATIGFPLIGRISGTEKLDSEILSFTSDKKIYLQWPQKPIIFTTTVKNNGNVDYLLGGNIFVYKHDITNDFWNTEINKNDYVVLPGNTRSFNNEWTNNKPLISINEGSLVVNTEYFRMGKVTATAKIGYDVDGKRLVADRDSTFWILPIPLIIVILAVLTALILITKSWQRKNHKSKK